MAELLKKQNFSAYDISKLQASLYDMKLAHGTTEYLGRFVGWESRQSLQQELALFAIKTEQGEIVRKVVFASEDKVDDLRRLKLLFALVFSARKFEDEELVPTRKELEIVN